MKKVTQMLTSFSPDILVLSICLRESRIKKKGSTSSKEFIVLLFVAAKSWGENVAAHRGRAKQVGAHGWNGILPHFKKWWIQRMEKLKLKERSIEKTRKTKSGAIPMESIQTESCEITVTKPGPKKRQEGTFLPPSQRRGSEAGGRCTYCQTFSGYWLVSLYFLPFILCYKRQLVLWEGAGGRM